MKTQICLFFGTVVVLGTALAADALSPLEVSRLLRGRGLAAKPHYSGVPDAQAIYKEALRSSVNRGSVKARAQTVIIPEVRDLDGFTMSEFVIYMDELIRKHDPTGVGINLIINLSLDPNGPSGAVVAVGSAVIPIDPVTGLPVGAGAPAVGGVDPVTGLPIQVQEAAGNAGGGIGLNSGGALNPDDVKIVGLKTKMKGLTVLQIIEAVTQSFGVPIQYVIVDHGIMFLRKPASQAGYFTRVLKTSPSIFSQGLKESSTSAVGQQAVRHIKK